MNPGMSKITSKAKTLYQCLCSVRDLWTYCLSLPRLYRKEKKHKMVEVHVLRGELCIAML